VIFLNLEDETGLINVICTPDVKRYRKVARTAPALEIRGCSNATRA
jgi:error-prone DNA polymerase